MIVPLKLKAFGPKLMNWLGLELEITVDREPLFWIVIAGSVWPGSDGMRNSTSQRYPTYRTVSCRLLLTRMNWSSSQKSVVTTTSSIWLISSDTSAGSLRFRPASPTNLTEQWSVTSVNVIASPGRAIRLVRPGHCVKRMQASRSPREYVCRGGAKRLSRTPGHTQHRSDPGIAKARWTSDRQNA